MPEANLLTLEITANILASHGLLDEQPPFKPLVEGTRRCVWLMRAATGWGSSRDSVASFHLR
jgi:hypothetical protein